jgi:urea transporter/murein DD-endopeptidase MepM/ murein hydrolase activator NlpD
MNEKAETKMIVFIEGLLFSYSQVFFSKEKVFAVLLMIVTFFDWLSGLSGLIAVLVTNIVANLMGYSKQSISQGFFGFNSLLVGLGMGIFYQPDPEFYVVLVFAALFTLFLTIWFEGFFGKYGLPYLSWSFLFVLWMVILSSRQFTSLHLSERGIFTLNEMYDRGGILLVNVHLWLRDLPIHESIIIYFRSLAAIFFQYHLFAGIIMAIGLLIYSRIAFLLSLVGFFTAYLYYFLIGINMAELNYSYIGFNFILTAIAIGGFFIVPSWYSFLWVVLLTPVTAFLITSSQEFFNIMQLPIFSLAFNIIVLLFLYVLKFRERHYNKPELVVYQNFSPERNLYSQQNFKFRFDPKSPVQFILPVFGEWMVTQGHSGEHTHREEWRHAWDFEMADEEGKRFMNFGEKPTDYYCYGKPVVAPADGVVQEIRNGIKDNNPGEMDLEHNWGNTIVIRHADKIYSKLSHLKPDSIKVNKDAFVKRGDIIALAGNSGRSPIPHLHFQIQSDPYIGSKTADYPISKFLLRTDHGYTLKTFERPLRGQRVSNIVKTDSLHKAFLFVPGQTLAFNVNKGPGTEKTVTWQVKSDMYNNTYFECSESGSKAWFRNDGMLFYFSHFTGSKDSLLFYFYLGAYKIALGYVDGLIVKDTYPVDVFKKNLLLFLQDFVAPFYIFLKADYVLRYLKMDDELSTNTIRLGSSARINNFGNQPHNLDFEIMVKDARIEKFTVQSEKISITATEIES